MGFIHFNENGWIVGKDGNPLYIVGINYVASYVCTNFLEDFRPEVIERDMEQMEKMGFNALRIPIYWGFFEPEEKRFNERAFENFSAFLSMAKSHGFYVMPWLLVGVATKDADIPYRQGRPIFEGDMLFAAENHLRTFARRYKDEEGILFWDICDEPEFYARHIGNEQWPYNTARFNHWLRHMYEAFKKEDSNHLVTLGFGEIATENYGYTLKDSAEILDVMSVTCYPYDSAVEGLDTARNNSYLGFYVKMNSLKNKPVFTCEAPGFSEVWFSKDMLGRYFRVSLYSNLVNGSTGTLPWCYNDFAKEIWTGTDLDRMVAEPSFGIVDNEGNIKPSGKELVEFGHFVRDVHITEYTRRKPKVAILIPAGYYNQVYDAKRKIRAAMLFLKGCGMDMEFIWDEKDVSLSGYEMVVACVSEGMNISTWENLMGYVEQGGILVHDYDGLGGLSPYFNQLFGVEVQTRQKNFKMDRMIMKTRLGALAEGDELVFPGEIRDERFVMGNGFHRQKGTSIGSEYLIVKPINAQVVAAFQDGTPALLRSSYGAGKTWLLTGQFHSGLFEMEYQEYRNHMMFGLYHEILSEEKLFRPCIYANAELETGLFEKKSGEKLLILINHGPAQNHVSIQLDDSLLHGKMKAWDDREGVLFQDGKVELTMEAAEVVKLLFEV